MRKTVTHEQLAKEENFNYNLTFQTAVLKMFEGTHEPGTRKPPDAVHPHRHGAWAFWSCSK